jgi:Heterokaryon incompatibility protein (HET)
MECVVVGASKYIFLAAQNISTFPHNFSALDCPMELLTSYTYDPVGPDQFRLCRFHQNGDSLAAELRVFPIDKPLPEYIALSYTWDLSAPDPNNNWAIQIGDRHLPVLDSLKPFFQALRSQDSMPDQAWWWIDSICIDQADILERSEHVRRMKQIYQNAHNTVVWLGEQSEDSDTALDFIDVLHKMSQASESDEDMSMFLRMEHHHPKWIALRNFFCRKWWTRVWTVQEFVVPTSLSFWCGIRTVSQTTVADALLVADRCNTTGFKDTNAFHLAWNRRRTLLIYNIVNKPGKDLSISLLSLAAYFCSNDASDDRDRLYGLNGLSTENHGLIIDYSWGVDRVYMEFAKSFITQNKSLDIICFASLFCATSGSSLPSWVPDWRYRREPLVVPLMVSQSSENHVGNLRPPSTFEYDDKTTRYSASGAKEAVYDFEGSTLIARGSIIDAIDGLAGCDNFEFVQGSESSSTRRATTSLTNILASVCRSLVLDRRERYLRFPMPLEDFYHDFIHLCLLLISELPRHVEIEFQQWFERVRSLNIHGHSFESILREAHLADLGSFLRSTPNQDEYIQDSFYGRFYDNIERLAMRLMTTHNGRIGMAPGKAHKGDLVCILYGCNVPVLLRKTESEENFTIVGECFLDGSMSGEALGLSDFRESTFRIV